MKITPLEIRQKSFEKGFRGYDKEEVTAFLLSMSNEWERLIDEQKELKIKLEQSEKEVQKLREVESSLFKTLKTAEDTGANMIDQATKAAELHLKETQMNADALMTEAKSRAKAIIEKAEMQSRNIVEEMQEAVKDLEQTYRAIENQRDNLVGELSNLTDDVISRVSKLDQESRKFKLEDHIKKVKAVVRESHNELEEKPLKPKNVPPPKFPVFGTNDKKAATADDSMAKAKVSVGSATVKKTESPPRVTSKPKEVTEEPSFFDQLDEE